MSKKTNWFAQFDSVAKSNVIPVIAEIKPSSPSEGDLVKGRCIKSLTKAYEDGGAACISVVTGKWFGGDLSMLSQVASSTNLPVLRKDLIVNTDEIKRSIDLGASAVLLTKKLLSARHLDKMIDRCISLNATPFIEVATEKELSEVEPNGESIIAITNRDIAVKEQDTDSGLKGLSLLEKASHNFGARISASGIKTNEEANQLINKGFDGLLVGTSLLQSDDPEKELRLLSLRTSR